MLAIFLIPVYAAVNIGILLLGFRFLEACSGRPNCRAVKTAAAVFWSFLALTPLMAYLLRDSLLKRILVPICNFWMGGSLYLILLILLSLLLWLILKRFPAFSENRKASQRWLIGSGWFVLLSTAVLILYGTYNARTIRITDYSLELENSTMKNESLNIALIADLHMGYSIGCEHLQQLVEKLNRLEPDLVCIAGDLFDNQYESLEDPEKIAEILGDIQSRYGVYACFGNHDYEEEILAGFTFSSDREVTVGSQMRELLKAANIHILEDETVLIDDKFYLAGRKDYSSRQKSGVQRKTPEELLGSLDPSLPVLVMDHQPKEAEELAAAGADLDLCGHTHDGQLFPANLVTRLMWPNSYGVQKEGTMYQVVTSGAGIFGPYMRIGTRSEIALIHLQFR